MGLRYELWESHDRRRELEYQAGRREANAVPGSRPGPKPLRIRADAASKTYRIEQQEGTSGGRWPPSWYLLANASRRRLKRRKTPRLPKSKPNPSRPKSRSCRRRVSKARKNR